MKMIVTFLNPTLGLFCTLAVAMTLGSQTARAQQITLTANWTSNNGKEANIYYLVDESVLSRYPKCIDGQQFNWDVTSAINRGLNTLKERRLPPATSITIKQCRSPQSTFDRKTVYTKNGYWYVEIKYASKSKRFDQNTIIVDMLGNIVNPLVFEGDNALPLSRYTTRFAYPPTG